MEIMGIVDKCVFVLCIHTEMDMLTRMNFGIIEVDSMTLTEKLQEIGKASKQNRVNNILFDIHIRFFIFVDDTKHDWTPREP